MFPKDQQEMKSFDENLSELDTTVKRLENEILLKKKMSATSPVSLSHLNKTEASNFLSEEISTKSPSTKETRIVNKSQLDLENSPPALESLESKKAESNKDELQANGEATTTTESSKYISEEYIPNKKSILSRATSPNISPKRSTNLVLIEQNPPPPPCPGSPINPNLIQDSIPIQFHQPPQQIPWTAQPPPQPHPNHHLSPIIHPNDHHRGAQQQLHPILFNNQQHHDLLPPHHLITQAAAPPFQPQMHFNARMQTVPAMMQNQHHLMYYPRQTVVPMPPIHPPNMQIPMHAPMQVPGPAPMHMMQFEQPVYNHIGVPPPPPPIMRGGVVLPQMSPEIAPGFAPGMQMIPPPTNAPGQALAPGTNVPTPLGMDSQMLAKYLLTAMAEECLTKKKSSVGTEGGNGSSDDKNGASQGACATSPNISSTGGTLFPSPNIHPLIQPPKVEIDFSSPTCFSQDVFKKKCKRKAKVTNPSTQHAQIAGQYPFPEQIPMETGIIGPNLELEVNAEQHPPISPPSSPTCLSFKASVPVSILGDNPFSESITKIVANKVSQCYPQQYNMPNGNFSIKSGFQVPINPQVYHH